MALRCKTMYSNDPKRLETLDVFDSEGNCVIRAVKSKRDKTDCEAFYSFREGKPHLERRTERERNVLRNYVYPKTPKGKVKITETYYRDGREIYTCRLNEKLEPIFTYWHDSKETVIA